MRPWLLSGLFLASCARVEMPQPPSPAPLPPDPVPAAGLDDAQGQPLDAVLPRPAPARPPDPLLESTVAHDPAIQERIDFWIGQWTGPQGELFGRYLERMQRYGYLVDDELERRGLPPSLRYLPIVESGYLPVAVSRAGATGLWQIMTPTARGLGLSVTGVVDDRRDPVASTLAALDYLEELYAQFDSWILALAAYNAGPGRVSGVLNGNRSLYSADEQFLTIRPRLPAETRDFIPRFFAAAALAQDPESYGLARPTGGPLVFDEVIVPDATSLDVVARAAGVSEAEILELNPHLLRGFTPVGELRAVRVPLGRSFEFERNYALIPPSERLTILEHVVASGETFSHIAQRYGVSLAELTGMNAQVDPRRLQIGMRLLVPVGGGNGGYAASPSAAAGGSGGAGGTLASATGRGGVHTVSPGDSLWTISRIYGVSTDALARANGKREGDLLRVGEELRIP